MRGALSEKVTWAAFSIGMVWLCGAAGQKLVDQRGRVLAARRAGGDEAALPGEPHAGREEAREEEAGGKAMRHAEALRASQQREP